jgi:hypothetical protein
VLPLDVGLDVALGGREDEPVAHVGDTSCPVPVRFGVAVAAAEALDNPLHVEETLLGVLVAVNRKGVVSQVTQV